MYYPVGEFLTESIKRGMRFVSRRLDLYWLAIYFSLEYHILHIFNVLWGISYMKNMFYQNLFCENMSFYQNLFS